MMHEQKFLAIGDDISQGLRDLIEVIKAADRGRNDALSVVGSMQSRINAIEEWIGHGDGATSLRNCWLGVTKAARGVAELRLQLSDKVADLRKAMQAQDVEIQGLANRLEANEQAVQSCLSTLGELNKVVRAIASKIPE